MSEAKAAYEEKTGRYANEARRIKEEAKDLLHEVYHRPADAVAPATITRILELIVELARAVDEIDEDAV